MKPEKIDLEEHYPCPRCKRGQLKAIVLTEAFGCDRCNQIFGLAEESYTLEQLSTSYPYKKAWQWSGTVWRDDSRGIDSTYLPAAILVVILPLLLLWLPTVMDFPRTPSMVLWSLLTALLLVIPALMFWLSLRQRR
ncbi:hypothetical protein [Candidatus Cyanaurora vandensis]|uniref:hypothetical protein n=1 Tax=Candidatus Cyanaurora vandensis TaxID=2714958 RepID=UPI00257D1EF1|nr:hypothetical protein [Candidatus Cyanaurora vandensis]